MTKVEREELIEYLRNNVRMTQEATFSPSSNQPTGIRYIYAVEDVNAAIRSFISENDMKAQPNWEAECKRLSEQCDCLRKHVEELQNIIDTKCGDYDRLRLIVSHIETLTGRKFE